MSVSSISVVIVTFNRAAVLALTLDHLGKCLVPDGVKVEVVVVDNNSSDSTRAVVEAFGASSPFACRYLFEARQGAGSARSSGLRHARGDVVAMVDDDVIPHVRYFEQIKREFERLDCNGIIGGRVELWNPKDLPVTIKTTMDEEHLVSGRSMSRFFILGCNMAIHRDVIHAIGGFDVRFGVGGPLLGAEEVDYYWRAFRAGFEVRYSPHIVAFHNHGRSSLGQVEKQARSYALGNGACYAKHILKCDRDMARLAWWDVSYSLSALRHQRRSADAPKHRAKLWHYALGALKFLTIAWRSDGARLDEERSTRSADNPVAW